MKDEAAARAMMRKILEKEGRRVREDGNGRVGLAAMERERPSLVLLDLMMGQMDGFEFADEVRRRFEWRSIPSVVVTAYEVSAEERWRLHGYADTILLKAGNSHEAPLQRVGALLDDCGVPRGPANATGEARAKSP